MFERTSTSCKFTFVAHTLLFAVYLVFLQLFLTAYFNDDKIITVTINEFNEAFLELIILIIIGILGLISIFFWALSPLLDDKKGKVYVALCMFLFIPVVLILAFWLNILLIEVLIIG